VTCAEQKMEGPRGKSRGRSRASASASLKRRRRDAGRTEKLAPSPERKQVRAREGENLYYLFMGREGEGGSKDASHKKVDVMRNR